MDVHPHNTATRSRLRLFANAPSEPLTGEAICRSRLQVPSEAGVTANGAALVDYMRHDKKMSGGTLPFLLARGIGQTFLSKDVHLEDVAAFLDSEA